MGLGSGGLGAGAVDRSTDRAASDSEDACRPTSILQVADWGTHPQEHQHQQALCWWEL